MYRLTLPTNYSVSVIIAKGICKARTDYNEVLEQILMVLKIIIDDTSNILGKTEKL